MLLACPGGRGWFRANMRRGFDVAVALGRCRRDEECAMYVCMCHVVTRTTIEATIAQGATTVEEVGRMCRAGTDCGKCQRTIRRLLEAHRQRSGGGEVEHLAQTVEAAPI